MVFIESSIYKLPEEEGRKGEMRLTDRLLSWQGMERCDAASLREIYELLLGLGVDRLEMSPAVYAKLRGVIDEKRCLRPSFIADEEVSQLPGLRCVYADGNGNGNANGNGEQTGILYEIRVAEPQAIPWAKLNEKSAVRLTVPDHWFPERYAAVFAQMQSEAGGVELCPEDHNGFAGALAVEWLLAGGENIAVSFLGKGGFAPLETVVMALWLHGWREKFDPSLFTRLREVYQRATGEVVPAYRAVVGKGIFEVESGVHVDGILKNAACYEPFSPETVGASRSIRLGKHSGRANVRYALSARGISPRSGEEEALLASIQEQSRRLGRGLLDEEFERLLAGLNSEAEQCV
ncbi:MAG: hypothetical protein LBT22_08585 [Peptococcaceae bacterium]|jgi:homocitrate synthase NifV|nr:hypothetical protein [Peptococcaceae bacterium]